MPNKRRKKVVKKAPAKKKEDEKEIVIDLTSIAKNPWRTLSIVLIMVLAVLLYVQATSQATKSILTESMQSAINILYSKYPEHLGLVLYLFGNPMMNNTFNETGLNSSMKNDTVNIKFFYSPRSLSSLRTKTFTINDLEALLINRTNIEYINVERSDLEYVNETINKYKNYITRVPALIINDKYVVNGEIDTRSVLNLVCKEYAEKPYVCAQLQNN